MSLNEKLRGILKKVKNSKSNDGVVEEIQALLEEDKIGRASCRERV